ncbi:MULTISPECIES: ATP-binding protein [unclassified Pseudoalteromonas]|uniref:ATP-binding protein n=1 Tax=unclassified Pseudoalteromonas TaxID=194690 RepID=UPI0013FE4C80|nr:MULTISPECIES: ATP-binding protein [unclassified Pseudoalteromonas]MBH0032389.1 AAA family ATPase [Pseudoalteromonas sp. SWYJZ98]
MSVFFTENKLSDYDQTPLYGLNNEYDKLLKFCQLVWSNDWEHKRELYKFNPTIMLYGSPGTGKTTLLKNVSLGLQCDDFKYFSLSLELLLDKDLGKSSQQLKLFFEQVEESSENEEKVFLHFDDVDAVLCSRYISNESSGVKRLVNTFIKEIDRIQSKKYKFTPIITTTTNMFSLIDTAVKRRFSIKLPIENNINVEDFKCWLKPIFSDLEIVGNIDYVELHEIVNEKNLTAYDVCLVMQNILLEKLVGVNIDQKFVKSSFKLSDSSKLDFEEHKSKLSALK